MSNLCWIEDTPYGLPEAQPSPFSDSHILKSVPCCYSDDGLDIHIYFKDASSL